MNEIKLSFGEVLDYPECPEIRIDQDDIYIYIDTCIIFEENEKIIKSPTIFVFIPLKLLEEISNKLAKELDIDPIIDTKSLRLSENIRLLENP